MASPRREHRDLAPPRLRKRRQARDHRSDETPAAGSEAVTSAADQAGRQTLDTTTDEHAWLFADLSTDPPTPTGDSGDSEPETPTPARAAPARRRVSSSDGPRVVRRRSTLRRPSARIAAVATGLLVGIVLVGLTRSGITVCEAARDVPSCGDGPGLLAQTVIVVLAYIAGRALLRLWKVADPDTISFLGLGGACAVVLIFLTPLVGSWVMAPLLPLMCALTYLGGWWLTTAVADTGPRGR